MLLTLLGLAFTAAAAIYVTWPLLAEASPRRPLPSPISAARDEDRRPDLEHARDAALGAIREAEFDHSVGKLSDHDYRGLRVELESQALRALAGLEALESPRGGASSAEEPAAAERSRSTDSRSDPTRSEGGDDAPATRTHARARNAFCASCGQKGSRQARFCAHCGARLYDRDAPPAAAS